jgi:hypothetical protein
MASHGGLKIAQEAIGITNTNSGGSTLMLLIGLCVAAVGIVALSLESVGAALVFFGIAGWLLA